MQQADVAAALDISRPTVSEWESARKVPSRDHLRELAVLYRVSLDWLLQGGDEPIVAETRAEEAMLLAIRQAPAHIQEAIAALLRPYAEEAPKLLPPPPNG